MVKVMVFVVAGDDTAEELIARLRNVPTCRAEVYACPRAMATVRPMPFLQVEGGQRFFGREGIETFLAEQDSTEEEFRASSALPAL